LKTVCLILKYPRIGEVKTRLANAIGAERATEIYRALVEHQCAEIPSEWEVSVCFTPATAEEEMRNWLEPHLTGRARFLPQVDGDLGQRLAMVVQTEFARERERIFLIGGDCPGLAQDYFRKADKALDSNDVVIGPAHDGGYVLLGLKRPIAELESASSDGRKPSQLREFAVSTHGQCAADQSKTPALSRSKGPEGLFTDIAWSSSAVLEQTLVAAQNQSLSVSLLDPLADIDDLASLNAQLELIENILSRGKRVRAGS
jgi:rSAM/selenodomain-associated transferase 1